jgi:hypothetical protein
MTTLALLFCFVSPKIPEEKKKKTSWLHSAPEGHGYPLYIFYLEWIKPQSFPHMYHEPRPTAVLKKTYLVVMHSSLLESETPGIYYIYTNFLQIYVQCAPV